MQPPEGLALRPSQWPSRLHAAARVDLMPPALAEPGAQVEAAAEPVEAEAARKG